MDHGLPSRQTVNAVGGRLRARDIAVGTRLWTLDGLRTAQTTVTQVVTAKARAAVEVVTGHATFTAAAGLPLAISDGWVRAEDAAGRIASPGPTPASSVASGSRSGWGTRSGTSWARPVRTARWQRTMSHLS